MVLETVVADAIAETVAAEVAANLLRMFGANRCLWCFILSHLLELLIVKEVGVAVLLHHHR